MRRRSAASVMPAGSSRCARSARSANSHDSGVLNVVSPASACSMRDRHRGRGSGTNALGENVEVARRRSRRAARGAAARFGVLELEQRGGRDLEPGAADRELAAVAVDEREAERRRARSGRSATSIARWPIRSSRRTREIVERRARRARARGRRRRSSRVGLQRLADPLGDAVAALAAVDGVENDERDAASSREPGGDHAIAASCCDASPRRFGQTSRSPISAAFSVIILNRAATSLPISSEIDLVGQQLLAVLDGARAAAGAIFGSSVVS